MTIFTLRSRTGSQLAPFGPQEGFHDIAQALQFARSAAENSSPGPSINAIEVVRDLGELVAGFPCGWGTR
jgi:hypothetical protein